MNDPAIWNAIKQDIEHDVPGFRVVDKSRSTAMRVLAAVLFFVKFKTFQTTIERTAYMTPDTIAGWGWVSLAHEGVHARDSLGRQVTYALRYLFPQLPLALGAIVVLGAFWTPWAWLALVFLLALIPWPAPGRVAIERKAYLMTMVCHILRNGPTGWVGGPDWMRWMIGNYTGPSYYFMSWDRRAIEIMVTADLKRARQICAGLVTEQPYSRTCELVRAADRLAA